MSNGRGGTSKDGEDIFPLSEKWGEYFPASSSEGDRSVSGVVDPETFSSGSPYVRTIIAISSISILTACRNGNKSGYSNRHV